MRLVDFSYFLIPAINLLTKLGGQMKTLITTFTLLFSAFTLGSTIEWDETRTSQDSMINLYELRCETFLGSNIAQERRESTVLRGIHLNHRGLPNLHFEYDLVSAQGCDRALLDQLVDDSFMRFNHAEAKITVIQKAAKKPRIYRGQCMRNVQEQVIIDFGQGTVLETSLLGKLIAATDC